MNDPSENSIYELWVILPEGMLPNLPRLIWTFRTHSIKTILRPSWALGVKNDGPLVGRYWIQHRDFPAIRDQQHLQ